MANNLVVFPAFGREYLSVMEIMEGWEEGHEFKTITGIYVSKNDVEDAKKRYDGMFMYIPNIKLNLRVF